MDEQYALFDDVIVEQKILLKEVIIKSFEEYDSTGERRIRTETTTLVHFPDCGTRHNPTKSTSVEYL
tara:strand:- start:28632 stop:28832 length:201 start_codon:yes stop_codon:yes gene_type:complete